MTFFVYDEENQPRYDGRIVRFNSSTDLPGPPQRLLYEHFKQAVLANMKGAGQPRDLDFDPSEDAQTMSVFEGGEGKDYLELFMRDKLLEYSNTKKVLTN